VCVCMCVSKGRVTISLFTRSHSLFAIQYVYVCVCIYVCVYMCAYVCTYVCMSVCIYTCMSGMNESCHTVMPNI